MSPSRAPHSEMTRVKKVKTIWVGDVKNPPDKARAAKTTAVIKKTKLRRIFFFNSGVVTFLNLNLPSRMPVAMAGITKSGSRADRTFMVGSSIASRVCGTKKAKQDRRNNVRAKA